MKRFIPNRLRIAREILGLSLDDLSKAMHSCVTRQSLSKYEQGAMRPLAKRMDYLSDALGVPKQFFSGEGMSIDIPKLRKSSQRNLTEEELLSAESVILFYAESFKAKAEKLQLIQNSIVLCYLGPYRVLMTYYLYPKLLGRPGLVEMELSQAYYVY